VPTLTDRSARRLATLHTPLRLPLLLLVLLTAGPPGAHAQEAIRSAGELEAGARLRVTSPVLAAYTPHLTWGDIIRGDVQGSPERRMRGRVTAVLVSAAADSLTIELERRHTRIALPWESVELLETSAGTPRFTSRWVAGGALLGTVAGAVLMARTWDPDECRSSSSGLFGGGLGSCEKVSRAEAVFETVVPLGVVGAGIGYLLGSRERWRPVAPPSYDPDVRIHRAAADVD
jgi:hypothetical protein